MLNGTNHFKNCLNTFKHIRSLSVSTARSSDTHHTSLSYASNQYGKLDIFGSTIGQKLAETALARPNDLAYKFCLTQTSFTFSELKQRVDELAQSLLNMGFKKGRPLKSQYSFAD
jgi:hypothetical protein